METIYNKNGFKIELSGNTYMVSNQFDCVFCSTSKVKATNFLKRALKDENKEY